MTPAPPPLEYRPVPAWVAAWALATCLLAILLLALGGFVTSFRVGMADPVWPTEPWFLFSNTNWDFGFVIEHTHRLVGWLLGLAVTVLAILIWRTEPDRRLRFAGFILMALVLVSYGSFHRGMGKVWNDLKTMAVVEHHLDPKTAGFEDKIVELRLVDKLRSWPVATTMVTALLVLGTLVIAGIAGWSAAPGSGLRGLAVAALIAVMLQGLLGGFRVLLHARFGPNLAAIHGAFGQFAFCLLVAVACLARPRTANDSLPDDTRSYFSSIGWVLVLLLGVQLIWAVMLRHGGNAMAQRLHLLTAFAIAGLIAWLALKVAGSDSARPRLQTISSVLLGLLAVQVALGVEAYLGKFAAVGAYLQLPPDARPVGSVQAGLRTAHQLLGCLLLAASVVFVLTAARMPWIKFFQSAENEAPPSVAGLAVAGMAGDQPVESATPEFAALALALPAEQPKDAPTPEVAVMALNTQDDQPVEIQPPDIAMMALDTPDQGVVR